MGSLPGCSGEVQGLRKPFSKLLPGLGARRSEIGGRNEPCPGVAQQPRTCVGSAGGSAPSRADGALRALQEGTKPDANGHRGPRPRAAGGVEAQLTWLAAVPLGVGAAFAFLLSAGCLGSVVVNDRKQK